MLKKKKTQALSLPPFLPLYKAIEYICSFLSSKKRKNKDREDLPAAERQIYARSGINLLACKLSPPSRSARLKDVLFIRRKASTCAKEES